MLQAIATKYYGPTNCKGSRIIARCFGGSTIMDFDHYLSEEENHLRAAEILQAKLGWNKFKLVSGSLPTGDEKCHVLVKK